MRRFVVRPEALAGGLSGRVRFDADQAHHLARVLRLGPGTLVEATDGEGRVVTVRIEAVGPQGTWGTIVGEAAASRESPCAITLAQAVLKGEGMTWLVQKATELGVVRLAPVQTVRVVARAPDGRPDTRQLRWARVAQEAVKQCGRAVVPVVEAPRPFAAILAETVRHDAAWLCAEGGAPPLGTLAREVGRPRRLLLMVGPEGGFTEDEVAQARSAGARLVGLGPRILRAESAGLVAVALCQHLFGDLGSGAT